IAEDIGKYIEGPARINVDKSIGIHKVQRVHDSHKESACHNGRNDRNENVPQKLDCPHKYILLLYRGLLGLCLGTGRHSGNRNEFVKDLIDCPCSKDDLKLSGCLKYALYAVYVFQGCFIRSGIVCNDKAKPCCAVCGRNNIFASAHMLQDFFCCFSVIHVSPPSFYVIDFISCINNNEKSATCKYGTFTDFSILFL